MKEVCLVLAVLSVSIPVAASATTRVHPVHPEREKMSPIDRRDAVLADLDSILVGPATPTTIATAPYLSDQDRICRRDVISLGYQRVNEDQYHGRVKPTGIGPVFSEFHTLSLPASETRNRQQKACEALNGNSVTWTKADSSYLFREAFVRLNTAVDRVKQGINYSIKCKDEDEYSEKGCSSEFINISNQVKYVRECDRKSAECYEFASENGLEFAITLEAPRIGSPISKIIIEIFPGEIIVT